MKLLNCPHIGLRPVSEFSYGGEAIAEPDSTACDDSAWADYVFNVNGEPGIRREWWHHGPSGIWFVFERDTQTDAVVQVLDIKDAIGG